MNPLRKLYLKAIKPVLSDNINRKLAAIYMENAKHKILRYGEKLATSPNIDYELSEMLEFLKTSSYSMIPYKFTLKYINRQIPVYYNSDLQMLYIVENEKKIYFKRGYTKEQALFTYNWMSYEQDELSPHRYLTSELHMMGTILSNTQTSGFTINKGDTVVDIGAAEGNFSFRNC